METKTQEKTGISYEVYVLQEIGTFSATGVYDDPTYGPVPFRVLDGTSAGENWYRRSDLALVSSG